MKTVFKYTRDKRTRRLTWIISLAIGVLIGFLVLYSRSGYFPIWFGFFALTRRGVETEAADRRDNFIVDPDVRGREWPYARTSDYTHSGYDRGHLVPSADRLGSQAENDATFRLSNIAPQDPGLNRGLWNSLEQQVRRMAVRFDSLWVVTGTMTGPQPPRIGAGGVAVPDAFYKVILTRDGVAGYRSIAFLVPNRSLAEGTLEEYAVSVDEVERQSGLDFFPALPDPVKAAVEARSELGMIVIGD